jgi:exonuclease SbcC
VILNKVKLNDFISHKSTELDLGYGINVVIGPNGSGKTSVLDAISFALFNDYSSRGKKENLINSKASKCRTAVEFTEGGIKYAVEWSMERNKSARGGLYRLQDGNRAMLAQGGGNAIVPEVEKILGIDKSMFVQSIYVRQGEIEDLVTAKPADRKALVSKLLGVEDLQRAWENIRLVIDEYEGSSDRLDGELAQKSPIEADKKKYIAASLESEKSLRSMKKALQEVEKRIDALQTLLDQLKESKKTFDRLDKEKSIVEKAIDNDRKRLTEAETELDKVLEAEKKTKRLEDEVNKLPFLEKYADGLAEKREQELLQSGLSDKLTNLDRLEGISRKNEKDHKLYLENEELLKKKNGERKKFEGANTALEKISKQIQQSEKEEQKKNAELDKELAKWTKALDEPVTLENFETILETKKTEFQSLADELGVKVDESRKQIGILENRKKELADSVSKLESSKAEVTTCPTCETELSGDRVAQLLAKFQATREATETELEKLTTGLNEIVRDKEQADGRARKADQLDMEKIKGLHEELASVRGRLEEQKKEKLELGRQAEELRKLDEELSNLEHEKNRLEETYHEFESSSRELAKLPTREQINVEMEPVLRALESFSRQIQEAASNLGYEPEKPDEELQSLRLKKQEYDQNILIAKRKLEFEGNVAGIRQGLQDQEQKLREAVDSIKKLAYDEEEHSKKQTEFEAEKTDRGNIKEEIAGLAAKKKETDAAASECNKKLEALKDKQREKLAVDGFIRLLEKIRAAYGKDGVQKMIRARARPLLERSTRDLFERFNLAYSDIKIDDDYNISVIGPTGEQDIDQISGGERVALAIALRLAIAQVLSGRVETIIMDEPTTHLDEERRKELVNILSSFFREGGRIIPQMLIITHHREIEDVADVIYNVNKKEGYSVVEAGATMS